MMYLIEYKKGRFINGELIDWITIKDDGGVCFALSSDPEYGYKVDDEYREAFLNHLSALNDNITPLTANGGK